jgi:GNAT superfamily N-acetyltransferase
MSRGPILHEEAPDHLRQRGRKDHEWFARRYPRFLYVDRIFVSAACRGLRMGSLLYEDLFRRARDAGFPVVTCEYNLVPLNEPSQAFHNKFGFTEQGTQWLAAGTKQVSLQVAEVLATPARPRNAKRHEQPTRCHLPGIATPSLRCRPCGR